MEVTRLLIIIFLMTCLSSSTRTTAAVVSKQSCHPQDKKALIQIANALGNPEIDFPSTPWDPSTDCCRWDGIGCHPKTNRVTDLIVVNRELTRPSQIHPAVGDLDQLENLKFELIPKLVGPIPPTITKLKKLRYLSFYSTNVSGEIPEFLSELKQLVQLELHYNNFSGKIPPSLARLPKLTELFLDGNRFTGSIPESFGSFGKQFSLLMASNNLLSGKLPASLQNLNLVTLDLSHNNFEGDASILFGSNKRTTQLVLSRNKFSFDLGKVGLSKDLTELDLSHNQIYGKLPQGLVALKKLNDFDVSHNMLCGEIPKGGKLQSFDALFFSSNKCLCGPPLKNPCK